MNVDYTKDKIRLFNCDCMKFMAEIPDNYYELAIVDPPYRDSSDNQPTLDMRRNGSMANFGDKPDSLFFNELFRISKNQIIWGANNFVLPTHKGFVIWRKKTISEKFTMSMAEMAYLSEGLSTISKVFELQPQDKHRIHPTQKPIMLYKWLLAIYAKKGDKIFDSHGGSFSSACAALDMGFEFDGCELDEDYFKSAVNRLENHNQLYLDL